MSKVNPRVFFEKVTSKEAWKIRGAVFGFIVLGIIAVKLRVVDMVLNIFKGNPVFAKDGSTCLVINIFGIPCPLCGMSRSFERLIQMDFAGSIYYNPFSILFFPLIFILLVVILVASLWNYKLRADFPGWFWKGMLAVLVVEWAVNIFWGHH